MVQFLCLLLYDIARAIRNARGQGKDFLEDFFCFGPARRINVQPLLVCCHEKVGIFHRRIKGRTKGCDAVCRNLFRCEIGAAQFVRECLEIEYHYFFRIL